MLKNPFQYSISTWFVVTVLIAVGMTVGPVTWFLIGVIECLMFYFLREYLSGNLPNAIEKQLRFIEQRANRTRSSRRKKIENTERLRFKLNVSILVLVFFAATNIGLLALRVDRVFEGETYVIDSPSVETRPGRIVTESEFAREIGSRQLELSGQRAGSNVVGMTRFAILLVVAAIWLLAIVLIPVGYVGMLRTMAVEANARSENYRAVDLDMDLREG